LKIVLDTNVLVSAFLKPRSYPAKILYLILQGDFQIIINEPILAEYREVLLRPKFDLAIEKVEIILGYIRTIGIKAPAFPQTFQLPDSADEAFLEAAMAVRANAIVTGNKKHFPEKYCHGIKISEWDLGFEYVDKSLENSHMKPV